MTKPIYSREALAVAVAFTSTMTELLQALDVEVTPGRRAAMWARLGKNAIDTSHWVRSDHARRKYSDAELRQAVTVSQSMAEVMRRLDIKLTGGSYSHLRRRIRAANLDTSHFLGQAINRGKPGRRRPASEILVVLPPGSPRPAGHLLKRAMIECEVPYECALCGLGPLWQGRVLNLAVDHIDGDYLNGLLDNLRFLCPNCHAQTSTWCRRKGP
ncbi:MAG: hypothetical protein QOI82_2353 [Actinomycetota bacterium]|jgi:hypothetical protein|nr:hypothetical protein [Actinomycetota bacterium]